MEGKWSKAIKKFAYQLVAPGLQSKMMIMGTLIEIKPPIKCMYIGPVKYLYAGDEEAARSRLREVLGHKWDGFILLGEVPARKEIDEDELNESQPNEQLPAVS